MQTIATNGVAWSVCVLVTTVSRAIMDEPIEKPSVVMTCVGQRNHLLDGGAHRPHLANTMDQFLRQW